MATSQDRIRHQSSHLSSRATKGKQLFVEGGDARSAWSRRWRDLVLAHIGDLGGFELVSEAQISICRRASTLEVELELLDARLSEGKDVDRDLYARLASRLCRLFDLIGVKRIARPIDPLSDLAKSIEAYSARPIDDDGDGDEPLPIEEGLDRSEPGEA
jgi:hypothetical protein